MLRFAMVPDGDFQRAAFFDLRIFPEDRLPPGAVRITPEKLAALLAGQAAGLIICADGKGKPRVLDPALTRSAMALAIKHHAAQRIAAISPAWRQANDLRALLEPSTPEGFAATLDAERRFTQIDAVRTASQLIEDQLASTPDRTLRAFPVADHPLWPVFSPTEDAA